MKIFWLVIVLLYMECINKASAQALPKWEAGLGLGGQVLRDYRGSKEGQVNAFPFPFVIYRGDFIKADRGGVRGEFLTNDRIEFTVSGEAALNGQSEDNELREGMPELESAFELGPSLNINLTGEDFTRGWQLRLPLRAVTTVGRTGVHYEGYNFNPRFTYNQPKLFNRWLASFNVGVLYGSNRYHDYYYTVREEFVTPTRPRYEADAGFSGYYFKAGLSARKQDFWYGLSLRYDNLSGTTFEDSPLVETNDYFSFSFAVAWIGWKAN
ncbi:MipA/OmpV family protein [Agarilytica rhodophyticola]|uniref:MipA/OmpV family protein n=1 Tax=Agarilytica rhodophyticola TaxID=1737490 RepID=UPI000B34161B|nr:MipA/OmpV family protein [Agarilytica rhodophyticola]